MRFCRFKFLHEINYVEVGDVTDVIFMSSPSRDSVCSEVTANEDEPERRKNSMYHAASHWAVSEFFPTLDVV